MRLRRRFLSCLLILFFLLAEGCNRAEKSVPRAPAPAPALEKSQAPTEIIPAPRSEKQPAPQPVLEPSAFPLANGLRVRLVPSREDKKVIVLLGLRAGFFEEPAGLPHIAHIAEHLTVYGAAPGSEEAAAVDRWFQAGQANAETLADFMYFDLLVTPDELPLALRVQAGRLQKPEFSDKILAREIPRALGEIESLERAEQFGTGKFAFCPLVQAALHGQTEVPIKAKTRALTIQNVRDFHKRTFRPDRAVLYVVGDFDPASARKTIESAFGAIPKAQGPLPVRSSPKKGSLTVHWDAATRHLLLVWPAPAASEPDHAALTLVSFILGQRLSTDRGINALAQAPLVLNEVEGFFLINVQAKAGADADALKTKLFEHIARMTKEDGLGDPEIKQTRMGLAQMLGDVNLDAIRLPPNVSKMMVRANHELGKLARELVWGDLDAYQKRLNGLDAAAVREAVGRHLDQKAALIVRLEPSK